MGITISGGTNAEQQRVESAILAAINKAHTDITNPFLKKCVENHLLLDGEVIIEHGQPCEEQPTLLGWNTWSMSSFLFWSWKDTAEDKVHICIDHIASDAQLVSVLIHEFAHSCCWGHGDNSNVPGDNGTIGPLG